MGQLEQALETQFKDQTHMVAKVINSTTGFLTAKGTEAGAMLSTILANADSGIQGVMNETEKTTVKVTRTVTEQVLSGGQLTQITKIVNADGSQAPPAFQDFINNIATDSKQVKTGTTLTTTTTTVDQTSHTVNEQEESEKREDEKRESISSQAEQVVNRVINAAVEIVNQDEAGGDEREEEKESETNVEIEEQSTVTTSTTKIVLNGDHALDQVQSEFFKQGKQSAQEVVSKLNMNDQVEIASN
ncbi:hypothetical protein BpHYR1_051223 [Brachionus plicatilis]|uniref:Uncharacterized protein n=1 Tax=Brachionus plicatilis TaxID=10195 RepID=A0A3M7SXJ2_BRAPC|nr:hypothetical protein BpHYR1_051223 [Brachionus plicatilis]